MAESTAAEIGGGMNVRAVINHHNDVVFERLSVEANLTRHQYFQTSPSGANEIFAGENAEVCVAFVDSPRAVESVDTDNAFDVCLLLKRRTQLLRSPKRSPVFDDANSH